MDISNLTNLLLYLILVSALAEKIAETAKHAVGIESLDTRWKKILVHVMTLASAGGAAFLVPPTGIFMLGNLSQHAGIVTVAILGSSGSGIWHDLIGVVNQYKQNQKSVTK